jgi:hypothetical protein
MHGEHTVMRLFPRLAFTLILLAVPVSLRAQEEEVPLGDLARSLKNAKPAAEERPVIDNDNLPIMMDKAEAERLNGKPVFSIDPSGKTFRMTSPDGTCSLSFDARAAALIKTPYVSSDLPQYEVAKLDADAAVRDGILEVRVHNATAWELKEIVVGITQLNPSAPGLQSARLITDFQLGPKAPDITTIYHLKATAPADGNAVFRGEVSDDLGQSNNWHWALVSARGVPPAAPAQTSTQANVGSPQGIVPMASVQQLATAGAQTPAAQPAPVPSRPVQPAQVPVTQAPEGSSAKH